MPPAVEGGGRVGVGGGEVEVVVFARAREHHHGRAVKAVLRGIPCANECLCADVAESWLDEFGTIVTEYR